MEGKLSGRLEACHARGTEARGHGVPAADFPVGLNAPGVGKSAFSSRGGACACARGCNPEKPYVEPPGSGTPPALEARRKWSAEAPAADPLAREGGHPLCGSQLAQRPPGAARPNVTGSKR